MVDSSVAFHFGGLVWIVGPNFEAKDESAASVETLKV